MSTENERGGSLHPAGSAFQLAVCKALLHGEWWPARWVAERVWPRVKSRAFGHAHGQWQSMGAQLSRLRRSGWVEDRFTESNQRQWRITKAGRAVAETQNDAVSH